MPQLDDIEVDVPDYGTVHFPSDMDPAAIKEVLARKFGPRKPQELQSPISGSMGPSVVSADGYTTSGLESAPLRLMGKSVPTLPGSNPGGAGGMDLAQEAAGGVNTTVGGVLTALGKETSKPAPKVLLPGYRNGEWQGYAVANQDKADQAKAEQKAFENSSLRISGKYLTETGRGLESPNPSLPEKVARMAGGFAPVVMSGGAAPLVIAAQTEGETIDANYAKYKQAGMADEDALAKAVEDGQRAGLTQGVIWAALPKPLQAIVGKVTGKVGGGAVAQFVAKRAEGAATGAALGAASQAGGNLAAGQPVGENVLPAAAGMAVLGALTPGHGGQDPNVPRGGLNKEVQNAVQIEKPNAGVLRPEPSGVGLPQVGKGNAKPEIVAGEGEGNAAATGAAPAPVRAAEAVSLPKKPAQEPMNPVKAHEFSQWAAGKTVSELRQLRADHEAEPNQHFDQIVEIINDAIAEKSKSLSVKFVDKAAKPSESPKVPETPQSQRAQEVFDTPADAKVTYKVGLTNEAVKLGASITTPEELAHLRDLQDRTLERVAVEKANLKTDPTAMNRYAALAQRKQFFAEAIEAATGAGGSETKQNIFRQLVKDYKPPFPEGETAQKLSRLPGDATGKVPTPEPIVDQPVKKGDTLAKPVSPSSDSNVEIPHSPLEHIRNEVGTLRLKSKFDAGKDWYGEDYDALQKALPELFSKDGATPDEAAQSLNEGGFRNMTAGNLFETLLGNHKAQVALRSGNTPEGRGERFQKALKVNERKPSAQRVNIDDLSVGDTFSIAGEQFKVTHIDLDKELVTVNDGPKFRAQEIPFSEVIPADKGSIVQQEQSTEFVPADKPAAKPKLAPGVNQGDLIASTQREDLALTGEKGTDAERLAAAKAKAESDKAEAAAIAAKQQLELTPQAMRDQRQGYWVQVKKSGIIERPDGSTVRVSPSEAGKGKFDVIETVRGVRKTLNDPGKPFTSMQDAQGFAVNHAITKPPPPSIGAGPGAATRPDLVTGPDLPVNPGNPDIYGVAARVRAERARAGQVDPVEAGQGVGAKESVEHGRELLAAGADAEKALAAFEATKKLSAEDMALVRARGEQLAREARRIEEKFGTDSNEYRAAFKALSDWDARSKAMQTEWHKTGQAQQGETDIDTGTFTGLARAHKEATGEDFTEPQAKKAKEVAAKVKKTTAASDEAKGKLTEQLKKDAAAQSALDAAAKTVRGDAARKAAEERAALAAPEREVWKKVREYIESGMDDYDEIRNKVATDLGMKVDEVTKLLGKNRPTKRLADEVWKKQQIARRVKEQAKRWLTNVDVPLYQKALQAIPRVMFSLKVGFHGTVALGTHAPMVAYQPRFWNAYVRDFGKMYKMVARPAYYERQVQDLLRRPNFTTARRAGLVNDPFVFEDYNSPDTSAYFGNLTGMGNRGYTVLKILRQDMFDQMWNKLPKTQQIPEVATAIADGLNHATGVVKGRAPAGSNVLLFAPRLMASRVAWLAVDPIKAVDTFARWRTADPGQKVFAINQVKEKAWVLGTTFAMLAINQGILSAIGSKQKVNLTDPMKSDFMKFKVAGETLSYGNAMLTMARLPLRLYEIRASKGGKLKNVVYPDEDTYSVLGEYARSQASPFASLVEDLWFRSDWMRRNLPNSNRPMPARLRRQHVKPYTWAEFWSEKALPIPAEEATREVWKHGLGMSDEQRKSMYKAAATIAIMAATGARLTDDTEAKK